ncbi:MAG TPA: molybdopterin-dependent oxidoreductase [Alphaproteobacteria bacterium]|jgi:DMSO/TMAO reductase YedYZ molybdopterin-dependent catalytic subunit|nr:molybdopterin-dependent oxidoreductase [Alphaproteobacteria bacterium]
MVRACLAAVLCLGFSVGALADPAAHSDSVAIKGGVDHPKTLALADLQHAPQTTVTISQHTGHGTLAGAFGGVSLWALLQDAGVTLDKGKKNDLIHHTVTVTGSDGYSAVLSLGEIAPEIGDDQAMIAWQQDGKPLEGDRGFARLIVPNDKAASRAVSAITTIEVK